MANDSVVASELWNRKDLVHVEGRVRRVSASYISIDLTPPFGVISVGWSAKAPAVGDRVTVAGELIGKLPRAGIRVFVVQTGGWLNKALVVTKRPEVKPERPSGPPPWIGVLVRHGLLESEGLVTEEHFGMVPIALLYSVHGATAARARGFVHYDVHWLNDTDDVIADLAAIAGCAEAFTLTTSDRDAVTFQVRQRDGDVVDDGAEGEDLELVAARVNHWLEVLGCERRIWSWDTGIDRYAFLGRTAGEVAAMAEDGLPTDGLAIAGHSDAVEAQDWSDV